MSKCVSVTRRRFVPTTLLLLGGSLAAVPAAAQTGTVTGLVTSAQGGQPIPAAQVYIQDLDVGVLSQANGRFTLLNVPPGVHSITAERIGYRIATENVTVAGGATVVQNFVLSEEALQLDEVIVTGTAGGSQRRAIGNVVAAVDVGDIAAQAPVSTVEDVLIGRTPGVHLIPQSAAGSGSKIRIRGHSSMALAGDPIIYVDGVRINDNRTDVGRHFSQSRLSDFDPNNIESIEIIKGPAAATLYGTEASAGVIQIVTRRGQTGAPVFDFSMELGQNYWPDWEGYNRVAWAPIADPTDPNYCASIPCANESQLIALKYADLNRELGFLYPWQNGLVQHYSASVRGGTDAVRYSFALSRNDQEGIVYWNTDERNSVQANIGVTASERVSLQLSGGYFQGVNHPPEGFWAGDYGWGGIPTGYYNSDGTRATCGDRNGEAVDAITGGPCPITDDDGNPVFQNRGWRDGGPEAYHPSRYNHFVATNRSTWSLQANLDATEWLSHRLTFGIDQAYEREESFNAREGTNFYFGTDGEVGTKSVRTLHSPVYTLDLSGTAALRLMGERLGTATSYGFQYYTKSERQSTSNGEEFAVRELSTVGAAATTTGGESFLENTTAGVYVQEQLDWDNRIFLTGAVRGDDNSAFGKNYEAAIYPKVSAAWVMHEESFWNVDWVDQFRLRGAWGKAGKQPDAFAATQLFEPETGPGGDPILTPDQYGNPDLGPEVGEEIELGFDASLFGGRIGANFTYYRRWTKDAIVGQTIPPSLWPAQPNEPGTPVQFVNVGQISGWGTETTLNVQAIPEGPVRLDVDLAFTTQGNRIDDMGDIERIQLGRAIAHYEGFPLAVASDFRVHSAQFVSGTQGPVDKATMMCDAGTGKRGLEIGGGPTPCFDASGELIAPQLVWGPTDPTRIVNVTPTLTILDDWRLTANVDAQWGHWIAHDYASARYTSHPSAVLNWLQDDPIGQAYQAVTRNGFSYAKAGFIKLREVSLTYTIPPSVAERFGASAANLRVGVRNPARLWLQAECVGDELMLGVRNGPGDPRCEPPLDPELTRGEYAFAGESGGGWPPIPQWTVRLGVTF